MGAHPLVASSSSQIIIGCGDGLWLERKQKSGAALAVVDTPATRKASIFSKMSWSWGEDADADADVKVKTPVTGREYTALAAILAAAASATNAPDLTLTFTFIESASGQLLLPNKLRGEYWAGVVALGQRDATNYSDLAFFGKFAGAVQVPMENGKEVAYDISFKLLTNTVDVVCTMPSDTDIHASAITIDEFDGITIVDTAV